jgi:hypothetical protein
VSAPRIFEERKAYIRDVELPCVWTEPGAYGDSRRKRIKPESITVEWHRDPGETDWRMRSLAIQGKYVHARSSLWMMVWYVDGARARREIPKWLHDLVMLAHPLERAA